MQNELEALVGRSVDRPLPPALLAVAEHVRQTCGFNVSAMLAYGSCLRGVDPGESLIDLYVLTADGSDMGLVGRMVPPNVYYAECLHDGLRYRAKYAVVPLPLFAAWMRADNPYFWARFAQPSALLHAANRPAVTAALARAVRTMFANAKGLGDGPSLAVWERGFRATYATELRPESGDRAIGLVAANAGYYEEAARILSGIAPIAANWTRRRWTGKLWSIARLAKAAFTFQGGADYIAWKIERHSGKKIALTDWQRRHPILGGLLLLPRLLRRGDIR